MICKRIDRMSAWASLAVACSMLTSPTLFAARINVPGTYKTISEAVQKANPGDMIFVAASKEPYQETQILIDKPLSIWGAGAEKTIIDGGEGNGQQTPGLIRIVADGVVNFGGFTLQRSGVVGIYASSPTVQSRYKICYNLILGTHNIAEKDNGIYAVDGKGSLIVEANVITGTGSNAILIEQHEGPTDVSYNTLDIGPYGVDAIFTMTYGGVNITSLQKRNNNTIDMGTGQGFSEDKHATGITFAGGYHSETLGDGIFSNVQIMRNLIQKVQGYCRGITLWNDSTGNGAGGIVASVQIVGNVISGKGKNEADSKGIQLVGLIADTKIINNDVSDLNIGVNLRLWNDLAPDGTKIISTKFNNVATRVKSTEEATGTKQHADHFSP